MDRKYIASLAGSLLLTTVLSGCGAITSAQSGQGDVVPTPPPAPTYAPAARPAIPVAPALPAQPGTVVFKDEFNSQVQGWVVKDITGFPAHDPAVWRVTEGRVDQVVGPEGIVTPAPTSYQLSTQTLADSTVQAMGYSRGNQVMGLVGRASDQGYYALVVRQAGSVGPDLSLQRYDAATETFTLVAAVEDGGWTLNTWHALGLTFKGDQIIGLVDGKAVIEGTDATYHQGTAGLYAYGEGELSFDQFVIQTNQ